MAVIINPPRIRRNSAMKRLCKQILAGLGIWLVIIGSTPLVAAQTTITPSEDATVILTQPNTSNNGAALSIQGQKPFGTCQVTAIALLKFNLPAGDEIVGATLRLLSTFASSSGSLTMGLYGIGDDTWQEGSVTWNTKPAFTTGPLSTASLQPAGQELVFPSTPSLTAFLETQRTGDGVASLGIAPTDCEGFSVTQSVTSREGGDSAPQLILAVGTPTAVSITQFGGKVSRPSMGLPFLGLMGAMGISLWWWRKRSRSRSKA
ncbi:MAG: DNRLRE domain-containing protein [Anaerolineae bacterium]|nr:DNRLRE domain-containing protein [Anaerolineae bacterium]MDW8099050.1 DNRLRE domain-containing protein [Anaerolineae bacterium]